MASNLELLQRLERLNDDLSRSRLRAGRAIPPGQSAEEPRHAAARAPYPGLRPFLAEESRFFRGRDAQVQEIGRRLTEQRCVAVLGGSGSGKSSIVRAGVIPTLRRNLIPDRGDLWRAAIFTPGRTPIDNLVEGLERTLYLPGDLADEGMDAFRGARKAKVRELIYREGRLDAFMPLFRRELAIDADISEAARAEGNLLVVVDQFEELFRDENHGKVQVSSLVDLLVDFWRDKNACPGLYLALTMRTDDLHRCAEFIDLPDLINATSFLTRRLREDELREAIVEPVRAPLFRVGLLEGGVPEGELDLRPFAVEAVTELLDAVAEIGHDPDHLPLLQHLLAVLWRRVFDRWRGQAQAGALVLPPEITRDDLAAALGFATWDALSLERERAVGNGATGWLLRECLNRVADGMIRGGPFGGPLSRPQQEVAKVAFCLMGEVDDRGNYKRRWTTREEIARVAGVADRSPDIDAVVTRFTQDHRLVWVRESGEMDVSHEALMRNWKRLSDWLKGDRRAASAYKLLAERYQAWQQRTGGWPQWTLPWAFWLRRRGGLLRGDELDRIEGELMRKQGALRRRERRYNSDWSGQQVARSKPMADGMAPASAGEAESSRYRFLRWSILRDRVLRALPAITLGLIALAAFQQARLEGRIAEEAKREAQRLREIVAPVEASKLWVNFPDWVTVPADNYVSALWDLRGAYPATRDEFVLQLSGTNFRKLGSQPQIVRAVGLAWPEKARQNISDLVKAQLAAPAENPWDSAALACASAVLIENRFLDKACSSTAVDRARADLQKLGWSGTGAWIKGRVLSCMGPHLKDEAWADDVSLMFSDRTLQDAARNPENLRPVASAATSTAWFLKSRHGQLKDREIQFLRSLAGNVLTSLRRRPGPNDAWKLLFAGRPLVSLIALLPPDQQLPLLAEILSFAGRLPAGDETESDLLLVLAQAFEVVAEQHRELGIGKDLSPLIAEAWSSGSDAQGSFNRVAVARLMLPLVEVAGADEGTRSELNRLVEPRTEPENGYIGLWGRHLALQAREPLTDAQRAQQVSEAAEVLKQTTKESGSARHFDGEGVARGLAALTDCDACLDRPTADGALAATKEALALTGSAETAAVLARAIVNLTRASGADKATRVATLLETLKYPNAGFTAREPFTQEPKNATDILLRALVDMLDPSRGSFDFGPAYYAKELRRLEEQGLLTSEQLRQAPADPRPEPVDVQPK